MSTTSAGLSPPGEESRESTIAEVNRRAPAIQESIQESLVARACHVRHGDEGAQVGRWVKRFGKTFRQELGGSSPAAPAVVRPGPARTAACTAGVPSRVSRAKTAMPEEGAAHSRRSRTLRARRSGTRVTCSRLCVKTLFWRVQVRVGRVRFGFGQRGGFATERRRTALSAEWLGRVGGGVGAPSVTSVLDESGLVGDNNRVWVSPLEGARSHHCSEAVQHECWRAARLGS
jgi:hypothetical protein